MHLRTRTAVVRNQPFRPLAVTVPIVIGPVIRNPPTRRSRMAIALDVMIPIPSYFNSHRPDRDYADRRLGVYCFSQEMITWSDLLYKCTETVPQSVWNELPSHLQAQVQVGASSFGQPQMTRRRMNDYY
ncbi:uncharacterized protein LOC116848816 [Odontomachus brunneus]|uniref:uncharacterized protein LOC116848816 n=1 Tax=Odontomachus brunneus TaxID=486640 RepID=UPI0013F23308|nr:uncharacterized protein LOC116848816 [Odontomachus brunneus]